MFLLLFFVTNIASQSLMIYDNTEQASVDTSVNTEPCLIETTKHFSLRNGIFTSGKLSLQSTRLVKNIMEHLTFLIAVEKPIYFLSTQQKWVVILSFKEIFKYSPLASDLIWATNACHPFLLIQKNGSMICKNSSDVRYTLEACAEMVKKLTKSSVHPPASESMTTLRDDIIYHMVEQQDGEYTISKQSR